MEATEKSRGHVRFWGNLEFFRVGDEVYRADAKAPLADYVNQSRHGRWECSWAHWLRYNEDIFPPSRQPAS